MCLNLYEGVDVFLAPEGTGSVASLEELQGGAFVFWGFGNFSSKCVETAIVVIAGSWEFPMAALLSSYIDLEQQK